MDEPKTTSEIDSWETEATGGPPPAKSGGSFFTFWRCCGCLALLGLIFMVIAGVAIKMGIDATFEVAPMDMPTVEFSQAEVEEIKDRFEPGLDSGETFEISPEELTILVNSAFQGPGVKVGPETLFYCGATPDGLLDLMIRLQIPEGEDTPFFSPAGRFMNLQLVGLFEIDDGEVTEAKISRFRLGKLINKTDFTEADSVELIRGLEQQKSMNPELRDSLGRIEVFKFDGENLQIRFKPEGATNGAGTADDPATPEELSPETPDSTEDPSKPKGG